MWSQWVAMMNVYDAIQVNNQNEQTSIKKKTMLERLRKLFTKK